MTTIAAERPGRREENKREKLDRIRKAAINVFLEKGFEGATLREIAAAANVAFGTLFLYAKDKQDLLLLVFDGDLPNLSAQAFLQVQADASLVDQLLDFFMVFYDFFIKTPQLSRDMMRETTFVRGIVAKRVHIGFENTERHVAMLVSRARINGTLRADVSPELAAHMIFSLFRIEIRFCLSEDEPDVARSVAMLKRQLELLMGGLGTRLERG